MSLAAPEAAGAANLAGKVIRDVARPLDTSEAMPPLLAVANTDSLGEQIQRALPETRVVKSLNTMLADTMVDPSRIPGQHNVFVAGEDADARATVKSLLSGFGWPDEAIIDLGGIRGTRGTETYSRPLHGVSRARHVRLQPRHRAQVTPRHCAVTPSVSWRVVTDAAD
ncbi:NADPH-dependent F420 reductase [Streptomyces tauricus]|uniref:NADPH-dependent F420 reductase n=1 Tax=Streptomyces tauricus TaxID=68274 RepID=UPI002243B487|nr:hypothetical protein [Streptomyces tauricus]MCW8102832.1 hypothetical protein [Streptomyces tauricus]